MGAAVPGLGADDDAVVAAGAAGSLNAKIRRIATDIATALGLLAPAASGGYSKARIAAGASVNSTLVKNAAGQVYGWYLFNVSAALRYVKLYDKVSAPSEADTPFATIALPIGGGTNISFLHGIPCTTGIGYRITTGIADNDTGAVTANDVHGLLLYK